MRLTNRAKTQIRLVGVAVLLLGQCVRFSFAAGDASPVGAVSSSIGSVSGSELLHVTVGRTLFLTTAARLKRVYISNPSILASFTASPNEVLVTAKDAGVSSVVIWDELGHQTAYTVSSDLDIDGLRQSLAAALPAAGIQLSALQGHIELAGRVEHQADADTAMKLAQLYSKDVSNSIRVNAPALKQVTLKVRFIEVDRVKLNQFGFNLLSLGNNIASTSTQQFNSFTNLVANSSSGNSADISNPLNLLLYNEGLNVGASIQDLEQKQIVQILAEPTITSVSGEEASFLSGGEFPFPVVQGGSGSYASVTVQFRPYGVKLVFTPTVNADGTIRLKVAPEVSALDYTNEVQISGYEIPAISTRRAETDVVLKSGQSFAISGLLDNRLTDQFNKMPGIASIPILGQLFRSKSISVSAAELLVLVTPTVVDPLKDEIPIVEPTTPKPFLDEKKFDQQVNHKPR